MIRYKCLSQISELYKFLFSKNDSMTNTKKATYLFSKNDSMDKNECVLCLNTDNDKNDITGLNQW